MNVLKPLALKIVQHFKHGLKNALCIRTVEAGMARAREPAAHLPLERLRRHARVCRGQELPQLLFGQIRRRVGSCRGERAERGAPGERRIAAHHLPGAVEHEREFRVQRLLDPQRSVIVERRDALCRRDEIGALARNSGDEIEDRALGFRVIPRRQGSSTRAPIGEQAPIRARAAAEAVSARSAVRREKRTACLMSTSR